MALGLVVAVAAGSRGALTPGQVQALPPARPGPVEFAREVAPILEARCTKCHAKGKAKGGFSLETREALMRGGDSGPAVVPGASQESELIALVAGVDPDNVMPKKGTRLTREEVGLLRAWIDAGATWDAGISFAKAPPRNLRPRKPAVPEGPAGLDNPIDRFLAGYVAAHGLPAPAPVEDRVFARRVSLDVTGVLPPEAEVERLVQDRALDKREAWVKRLLADRQRYAQHWLSFWNDLLRNDYRGTGYIDDGRKQISYWLYDALVRNVPYDEFVAQLLNPSEDAEGFVKGIIWRGAVNSSQTPEMQAAQNIAQVFMGVNLKCASCHDSFINDWTLADSYALASVYAKEPLEMFECDRPTGKKAGVRFIYPQLGEIPADASKEDRQKRLAEIVRSRENGRLPRTIVNRLWQRLMGRGLVEPVDDMEQPAWHPDLLDWLAEDLVEHGYDLQHTMQRILTSAAYQMPAVNLPEQAAKDYVFTGPAVRRLTAEQFRDALGSLTGVWFEMPESTFPFMSAESGDPPQTLLAVPARWIWAEAKAAEKAAPESLYFRKELRLESKPAQAAAAITCDNRFTLFVNGQRVASGKDHKNPSFAWIQSYLKDGDNLVAIEATNEKGETKKVEGQPADPQAGFSPAGLLAYFRIRDGERVLDLATDATWTWRRDKVEGWEKPGATNQGWSAAVDLGEPGMAPWKMTRKLESTLSAVLVHGQVRSSLVAADPLMSALGRPPREQLLTVRSPTATTLQALEMTNGDTLYRLLKRGAQRLLADKPSSSASLVERIFSQALTRPPTDRERALARSLIGEPPQAEGVEDLLWAVVMLPEFQLIY